jgi:uncharacterized protein (TIGR02444 family)
MDVTKSNQFSQEWDQVLEWYARPGVSDACIQLQDFGGVDVVVMLHAVYLFKVHQVALDGQQLASAEALVGEWRREVTAPLRALRTIMKTGFVGIPADMREQAREKIKAAELATEFGAFAALCVVSPKLDICSGSEQDGKELLQRVLQLYAVNGLPEARHKGSIQKATKLLRGLLGEGYD